MKILLDENLPHELRLLLSPLHDSYTTRYMRWNGKENGELLKVAAQHGFDALVTTDRGYEHQQNLKTLPCAVVLLLSRSNAMDDLRPLLTPLLVRLENLPACSFTAIAAP
jgi:predicted nuclease of predicted toxin-antitoxin system